MFWPSSASPSRYDFWIFPLHNQIGQEFFHVFVSAENEDRKEYMAVFCAFSKHEISKISGPVSDVSARKMA
jgi:hypothetical protein